MQLGFKRGEFLCLKKIGEKLDLDIYHWDDFKVALLELKNEEHRDILSYGIARGDEALGFIQNVLRYKEILDQKYKKESTNTTKEF